MKSGAAKYTVVTENGESVPMSKARAERVAKNLRTGKIAGRKFASPMAAEVKAVAA